MSPKVLVISNTALHTGNSNGRTLGLLLSGIPKENLMQFCIKDGSISAELVREAYCISDAMVLKGMLKSKLLSKKLQPDDGTASAGSGQGEVAGKNGFKFAMRELVWGIKLGSTDFLQRALDFNPDVILFQIGHSGFLADLAVKLAQGCKAKLVAFTTEDYYLKKWNFLQPNKRSLTFNLYIAKYRKAIRSAMSMTELCIANTPALAVCYARDFGVKTAVIMAAASDSVAACYEKQENTVVYAGNLTLNRYRSIIEIAKLVAKADPAAEVAVYGKTTPEIETEFKKCGNISVKGFVSYDVLMPRIANARLLLHCESFDEFYRKDLNAAFSTKIADCLASGVPLLLYAPEEFAETRYLEQEACAIVCTDEAQLQSGVAKALTDDPLRFSVAKKAKQIAKQNHSLESNQKKMFKLLVSVMN